MILRDDRPKADTDVGIEETERRAGDHWLGVYCRKVMVRHLMRGRSDFATFKPD